MNVADVVAQVDDIANAMIASTFELVSCERLRLDSRCGQVLVSLESGAVAVENRHKTNFEYHSGFEYVDAHHQHLIGKYTVYMSDSPRVKRLLHKYTDMG